MADMKRRGFLRALLVAPIAAKAALIKSAVTKQERVPLSEITKGKVIRLPSVMASTSCCIMTSSDW